MAKAVLVTDMPEQVCQKCTLCYETENDDEYLCCATGKLVPDGAKPDWCPLRELPERMEICGTYNAELCKRWTDALIQTGMEQMPGCHRGRCTWERAERVSCRLPECGKPAEKRCV